MSEAGLVLTRRVLAFAAVVETVTGLALLFVPRFFVTLLLGGDVPDGAMPLGRLAGIAILALGVACWPGVVPFASETPAYRAMLLYNVLIAFCLAGLHVVGHLGGVLLWPAVVLHAVVAGLLLKGRRDERRMERGASR
jgi:hypothetical protein